MEVAMTEAAVEVGPALFFSLMIITLSFIRCSRCKPRKASFAPLAFTKTYAMAAVAVGDPGSGADGVLEGYRLRNSATRSTGASSGCTVRHWRSSCAGLWLPRWSIAHPAQQSVALEYSASSFRSTKVICFTCLQPCRDSRRRKSAQLAANGSSDSNCSEVNSVFGKAGCAESATDPAPLEMFETIVRQAQESGVQE
jgi:Cu(I)/Ag(I) efflux system membrane protein CusA/SilA